jgi:Tol biopolymer transport system component
MVSPAQDPFRQVLVAVSIANGSAKVLKRFDVAPTSWEFGCTVSPDGHALILPTVQRYDSDVYLASLARK